MAAAGVAESSDSSCAVKFRCMRFEPTSGEIHVADRGGISCLGRLAKFDGRHQDASAGGRSVEAGIVHSVAGVPSATMRVDHGGKRRSSLRLINSHQPRLPCDKLVLDITFVDFVFCIVLHGGNLLPSGFALQARNIQSNLFLTAPFRCNKRAWGRFWSRSNCHYETTREVFPSNAWHSSRDRSCI